MRKFNFILLFIILILAGCDSKPKNEISFEQISVDFSSYASKEVTMKVIAIKPDNYFNFAFSRLEPIYWCVKVTDGTKTVYAYFPKNKFQQKKEEILGFKEDKITLTAIIASDKNLAYHDNLLDVVDYHKGW